MELRGNIETPASHDAWLKTNKGKVQDKRTIKDGAGGSSDAPTTDTPNIFGGL